MYTVNWLYFAVVLFSFISLSQKRENKNTVKKYFITNLIGILSKIVNLKFCWNTWNAKTVKIKQFTVYTIFRKAENGLKDCSLQRSILLEVGTKKAEISLKSEVSLIYSKGMVTMVTYFFQMLSLASVFPRKPQTPWRSLLHSNLQW